MSEGGSSVRGIDESTQLASASSCCNLLAPFASADAGLIRLTCYLAHGLGASLGLVADLNCAATLAPAQLPSCSYKCQLFRH